MVKKAKTVGQLLSALTKAVAESSPGTIVEITHEDGEYTVNVGEFEATGPKLYGTIMAVSKAFLGAPRSTSALDKLRGRLGGATAPRG